MGYRKDAIATGEIYHVFNRGVEKRSIVTTRADRQRWVDTIGYYRYINVPTQFSLRNAAATGVLDRQVAILAYCLMPNHFHLLLEQLVDGGITTLMQRAMLSYSRYYNTKYDRVGPLMQGPYRARRLVVNELLPHVSRYHHLNPVVAGMTATPEAYPWSSMREYLGMTLSGICDTQRILGQFDSPDHYREFVHDQIDYAKTLETVKHLVWS